VPPQRDAGADQGDEHEGDPQPRRAKDAGAQAAASS
jgi:hypothetical protein